MSGTETDRCPKLCHKDSTNEGETTTVRSITLKRFYDVLLFFALFSLVFRTGLCVFVRTLMSLLCIVYIRVRFASVIHRVWTLTTVHFARNGISVPIIKCALSPFALPHRPGVRFYFFSLIKFSFAVFALFIFALNWTSRRTVEIKTNPLLETDRATMKRTISNSYCTGFCF